MASSKYRIINAQFKSTCAVCGQTINKGAQIQYAKGQPVLHAECKMPEIPADAIRISGGSGYGCEGWGAGEIVWNNGGKEGSTRRRNARTINEAKEAWRRENPVPKFPSSYSGPEYDAYKSASQAYEQRRDVAFADIEAPYPGNDGPEFLYVLISERKYYSEDGMSFGVGDESGYVYLATCRPATDEESAPLRARIAESQRKKDAENRRKTLANLIRDNGEFPESANPIGDKITDRQNIYGGGDWFVLGEDSIWYVRNNGSDGSDWSLNNVGTGGAGALGWHIARTEELAEELLAIESILDLETAEKRALFSSGTITSFVYQKHFAERIDPVLWGEPASAPVPPPRITFVTLSPAETEEVMIDTVPPRPFTKTIKHAILAGVDEDCVWLAMQYNSAYSEYNVYGFLGGQSAFAVRYDSTPERLAAIEVLLPDWCSIELIRTGMAADRAAEEARAPYNSKEWHEKNPEPAWRQDFTETQKQEWKTTVEQICADSMENFRAGEKAAKEAREAIWSKMPMIIGRYRLPNSSGIAWATNNREALRVCQIEGRSLHDIEFESGVELIHNNQESRFGGKPWALWSDGRATTGECAGGPGSSPLSKPISNLVASAIRQKLWQEERRWRKLLDIEEIVSAEIISNTKCGNSSGGETRTLDRLTLRGGEISTLYRVSIEWWAMGTDGDAGQDIYIFPTKEEAEEKMR